MHQLCFHEVIELHRFIQAWLTGSVSQTTEAFARFKDVLAEDFIIISPGGISANQAQVCESFWSAYGRQAPPFSLEIRNLQHRVSFGPFVLVTYEEWQQGQATTARLSTALFRLDEAVQAVQWVHLHETWLPVESREEKGG